MSTTYTISSTFTITHARHLSSKVAADMHLCALYYGKPSEQQTREYAEELALLLRGGYVSKYEFGYERANKRIVSWRYIVHDDGSVTGDDSAGKIASYADVTNARFYNFLTFSTKWLLLSEAEREEIESSLPFRRSVGSLPSDGNGYWISDRSYCANGVGLARMTFRPSA